MSKVSCVYKIICLGNGKVYVGSAINFLDRKNTHFSKLRRNVHPNTKLQTSFNKYGKEQFLISIIELCEKHELLIKEQFWIDELQSCNKEFGFNLRKKAESNLGFKHSLKTKKLMSKVHKGYVKTEEHRKNLSKAHSGRKHSPERIEKNRNAQLGKTLSKEHKEKLKAALKGRPRPPGSGRQKGTKNKPK